MICCFPVDPVCVYYVSFPSLFCSGSFRTSGISILSLHVSLLHTVSYVHRSELLLHCDRSAQLSLSLCLSSRRSIRLALPLPAVLSHRSTLPKKMDSSSLIPCGVDCASQRGADAGMLASGKGDE